MAQQRRDDKYSNVVSAEVTQTGPDAITFTEVRTGISLGQGIGMVIDQIDYFENQISAALVVATGDRLIGAWCVSNAITAMDNEELAVDNRIIHGFKHHLAPIVGAAASTGYPDIYPRVFQFFPGIIVAAPRLYFGVDSNSLTSPANIASRLYFRYVELTPQEYIELAEAFILVG
ncbi:hypothetical protein LCGC14_2366690 [marine sediment metagenome]|uniref:Uncharacterized protein n=1 Tax=marine sediment metagenome TaxID=412755 RepID=A0A0F9CS98_9ZZZZ